MAQDPSASRWSDSTAETREHEAGDSGEKLDSIKKNERGDGDKGDGNAASKTPAALNMTDLSHVLSSGRGAQIYRLQKAAAREEKETFVVDVQAAKQAVSSGVNAQQKRKENSLAKQRKE
ncbi:hypothetical protein E4U21_005580 [Claviceps maximensis]|nr:hypothetical protein E4U21_005580 [Claviceps maximensis]